MRCGVLAAVVGTTVVMAAPVSHAALPPEGAYKFEDVTRAMPVFEVYATVKPNETYLNGLLITGTSKCSKGRTGLYKIDVITVRFPVTSTGSFSKSFKVKGEGSFGKRLSGKGKLKGKLDGTKISGKVTATVKDPDSGTCKLKGKFRATGKRVDPT